ncbi:MAG: 1-acylglycerol-3-phosphate O-acyltransferase [Thelocarpon superellum]|nr:MAG: 1-acylglycerol-3-phosphate O-acyltransferase [Thelocarpon superellum]
MPGVLDYFLYALGGYLGVTALLMALALAVPRAGFYGRLLSSYFCFFLSAAYGVVVSIIFRLVGYGGASQWAVARLFQLIMGLSTGVYFDVTGTEYLTERPVVFVGNHQTYVFLAGPACHPGWLKESDVVGVMSSELDVLMLGAIFPPFCSVTAKKSLAYVPVFGWFLWLSRTVFIDRGNRDTAMAAFDGAAAEMRKHKQSVFIFPEGTRSYFAEPDLLPFKKGAFHLAVKAKVPVVPVVVANYSNILHVKSKRFEAGHIPVRILPPIPTDNLTPADVDDLVKDTRDQMLAELLKLTEEARAHGVAKSAVAAKEASPTSGQSASVLSTGSPYNTRRRPQQPLAQMMSELCH